MALDVKNLIQNESVVPVCRVHVYQGDGNAKPRSPQAAKLPDTWCGPDLPGRIRGSEKPYCIIGREGKFLQENRKMEWEILDARVNITRQWASSQANFTMARPVNPIMVPEAPPVRINDVIVIEMGYLKGIDSRCSDKEGRTLYHKAGTAQGNFVGDIVFYGIVHTVKSRGGAGTRDGIVQTIEASDTMSLLTANKIRGHYRPAILEKYNRAFIIRDLLWRGAAIDYVQWEKDASGYYVYKNGFKVPKRSKDEQDIIEPAKFGTENCYLKIGKLEVSQRQEVQIPEEGNQQGIVLMDKYPLDVIRHFSSVETSPRELWADPRTGEIHWMSRRSDMRNLLKKPAARQYFYMYPPERDNIISYTNEWSSAGTITHFTLTNPLASVSNSKKQLDLYAESPTALLKDPHTGKPLRPMTVNRFIYDDTLLSENDAELVANALFTIWGRSIQTGMVMVPGDPTLEIGEAVQIFNTDLFGRRFHPERPGSMTNAYESDPTNPEGVYRVEAVTHLFSVGGVGTGYKTVFIFGALDTDTGEPKRLIKTDSDWAAVKTINIEDYPDNGNSA